MKYTGGIITGDALWPVSIYLYIFSKVLFDVKCSF